MPFVAYVHVEGMPRPKPAVAVRCKFCPKCRPDADAKRLAEAETARLRQAGKRHLQWEQKTQLSMVRVETHHVTVHAQLQVAQARQVGLALEGLAAHLQKLTGSMMLTDTRPDTYEMLILFGRVNYLRFLEVMKKEPAAAVVDDWFLLSQTAGTTLGNTTFFYHPEGGRTPPAHMAVFTASSYFVRRATGGRAPHWLTEGFAAYGENVVMRRNLVHSVRYELKDKQIGDNWALAVRQMAAAGQLKPWDQMLALDLRDYEERDHLIAYAMVYFLVQSQPKKFLDLCQQLKAGTEARPALEQVYGMPLEKLQDKWARWLVGRR